MNNNTFIRIYYNDNICEYSRPKVTKYYMYMNSRVLRLFHYFGAATVKAAYAYIDETNCTESFISSHLPL